MTDDHLTPAEREALDALPREQMPDPALEDRVVKALHDLGVLRLAPRRAIERTPVRIAMAAAAAVVLLLGGFAVGRWTGKPPAPTEEPPAIEANELTLAASLQRAGSAYVSALEELASSEAAPHSDLMRQGREVALTTLYSAAGEVSRIVPKRHMAGQLLRAIDVAGDAEAAERDGEVADRVIWF